MRKHKNAIGWSVWSRRAFQAYKTRLHGKKYFTEFFLSLILILFDEFFDERGCIRVRESDMI